MRRSSLIGLLLAALVLASASVAAAVDKLIAAEGPAREVMTENVTTSPRGDVTGVLTNRSSKELRDIRLLIHHTWLWKNEMKPGDDSPGRVDYYTVRSPLPPNGRLEFTYHPEPPLPDRDDGHFETSVDVVGWTEIGR